MTKRSYTVWVDRKTPEHVFAPNAYRRAVALARKAAKTSKNTVYIDVSNEGTLELEDFWYTVDKAGKVTKR